MKSKKILCYCSNCGAELLRYPSQKNNNSFCSKECKSIYFSTHFKGDKNPNYGKKWNTEQREKASLKNKQRFIDHPEYKKLCACNLGKKLTETSRKLKEFYKTHHSHMYGKTHSDECKKNNRQEIKIEIHQRIQNQNEKNI